jgi:CDP-diacylglycerol--glycerol-3-phosphate 3-phosphatidyltransferase
MASLSGTQKSAARCFYNAIAGPSTRPRGATSVPRRILATPRNPRYTFIRHNSSTSASKPSIHPPAIPHSSPAFEELAAALSSSQPCFGARGDEITLMDSPTAFYDALIDMISRAKRRIIISSLYIGAEESELVSTTSPLCRYLGSMLMWSRLTRYGRLWSRDHNCG